MKTFATPISVINNISNIRRGEVVAVQEFPIELVAIPYLIVHYRLLGSGGATFNNAPYALTIYDTGHVSKTLAVNPSPTEIADQILVNAVDLPGNQYTALAAAWHSGGSTAASRKRAVEDLLVAAGVLSSAFA